MPSRDRKRWKPDSNGIFSRQIGYANTASGKLSQPKFRLGTDSREASRRAGLIRTLWDHIEARANGERVCWSADALDAAKQIGRGATQITVTRCSNEVAEAYAQRVNLMRRRMPMLAIVPADEVEYAIGVTKVKAVVEGTEYVRRTIQSMQDLMLEPFRDYLDPERQGSGQTFHAALRAHIQWIKKEYRSATEGTTTQWGRVRVKRVQTLMDHHRDFPLSVFDLGKVEELFQYWRNRPPRKGTDLPVARKSASNQVTALKDFIKWLHRGREFTWRKPDDLDLLDTRVKTLSEDRRRQVTPDVLFSRDELVLLNKYATPLERLMFLLGLNCGFGRAEIASLLIGEVYLNSPHDGYHQEILAYPMTNEDSFIKRVRRKSGVYGEHILFSQTAQGVEWAMANRKRFDDFGPDGRLLLNDKGHPYDKPTKSGNTNQQISNRFADLCQRIRDDGNEIRNLSFGKLRKTAGDLIRRFSDGEVSGVFLFHGRPVETDGLADLYSSRPFGNVFRATRQVEEYLAPVFAAAGPEPFRPQPQAYTKRTVVERIVELHTSGASPAAIATEVGKSVATVQRHITREFGPRPKGRPR